MNKEKGNMKKIVISIIVGVLAIAALALFILWKNGYLDAASVVPGANAASGNYERVTEYYDSIEEALEDNLADKDIEHLYTISGSNCDLEFYLREKSIACYEIVKKGNQFGLRGVRENIPNFMTTVGTEYTWQETVKGDLSASTITYYRKNVANKYGILPVWGLSEYQNIDNILIDGQKIDHILDVELEGKQYKLWIIEDLKTENGASDIVITEQ